MRKEISKYSVKFRLWISGENGTYLGEGRIMLLQAIDKFGSISEAARQLNMSYKKAWELVNAMNKESEHLLVIRNSGGKGGGGTVVTPEGKKIIDSFNSLYHKCEDFLNDEIAKVEL